MIFRALYYVEVKEGKFLLLLRQFNICSWFIQNKTQAW